MLNSTEHEISTAKKTFKVSNAVFAILINVKMQTTIVGMSTFMEMINQMLR